MSLRDGPLGGIKAPLRWVVAVALVIASIAALAVFLGDRRESVRSGVFGQVRQTTQGVITPVAGVVSTPFQWLGHGADTIRDYFLAGSQNADLRRQLAEAQAWKNDALALREENIRYRALLGVATQPPMPMVFARTVLDARGAFSNTRLADAGARLGVAEGNPVLSEHGLVGRVAGLTADACRIMLLTDADSRIPVLVLRTNGRAILTGDGGGSPRLAYVRSPAPLREGDRVLTSGDGGVIPRGLAVGAIVKGFDGSWRVALDSDASPVDFVQILLFHDFSQLVDQGGGLPRELPGIQTEPPEPVKPAPPAAAALATRPPSPTPVQP